MMKRSKLNEDTFKSKKYEKDNLRWIKEAVRDCGKSYCFAAAYEFKRWPFFPSANLPRSCFCRYGNNNEIMLSSFKKFLEFHSDKSDAFKYRSRMLMHYAPLLELFDFSTHFTFGMGRETCYILQLPTYAHLGFRNYFTETFIHIVNFIAKWPLAFRKMLQKNSSINLSGKAGKGIEHDAWVEGCIVQPIKQAISGHTTLRTCLQIAGSLDIIQAARESYRGKQAFHDHTATRHSVSSPLPDQLKGALYCISNGLLSSDEGDPLPTLSMELQTKLRSLTFSGMWKVKVSKRLKKISPKQCLTAFLISDIQISLSYMQTT